MNTKSMRVVIGGWEDSALQRVANTSRNGTNLIQWSALTVPTWSFTFTTMYVGTQKVAYNLTEIATLDLGFKNI